MAADMELSNNDYKEFANIYAGEFNRPEMHDRVLVLDVFNDNNEDEIEPTSDVIKQEQLNGNDENAFPGSPNVCTRAMSKIIETQSSGDGLDVPAGKTKLAVKRKASIDRDIFLRNRKVSKFDNESIESFDSCKAKGEFSPRKEQSVSNQHRIFAHSSWLAVQSNYFRALFYSGMKESHLKVVHLKIRKREEAAYLHLIEAMYSLDVLNNLPAEEVLLILVLADKYDAKFVFRKCKCVLKTKVKSVGFCENLFNAIKVEQSFTDVDDLIDEIQAFLAKTFSPFDEKWESSSFENLSENLLTLLLSSSKLISSCEDVIFHGLMHWIKNKNYEFTKDSSGPLSASSLLSVIRFEYLSIGYLVSVVKHHPIATQMANFKDCYLRAMTYAAIPCEVVDMWIDMDVPEQRKEHKTDIVNFCWKMPAKEILKAITRLESQPFWACGYRMQLSLRQRLNYDDKFFVTVVLKVLNLKKDDFTSLIWLLKYKNQSIFLDEYFDEDFVFTHDRACREKEATFKWVDEETCILKLIMRPSTTTVTNIG